MLLFKKKKKNATHQMCLGNTTSYKCLGESQRCYYKTNQNIYYVKKQRQERREKERASGRGGKRETCLR